MSKRYSFQAVTLIVTATCALALSSRPAFAVTVFSDQFNAGSTIDQAPGTPTATSTSYEFGAGNTNNTAVSVNPGDLSIALGNTSSVDGEIAALFAASPVTLANIGDFIDLQVTWVATSNVFSGAATASTQVALGLYDSGGSAPQQGATLFNSANSPTGGAQNWAGYYGFAIQGSNSKIDTRPKQTGATATNQELLFGGTSGSQAFGNPAGAQLTSASKATTIAESAGATNTSELRITLTGVNSLAVSNTLFSGAGTGGTIIFAENGTTNNTVTDLSFDGLAFGYRYSGTQATSALDVQSITVLTSVVPEPSTVALVGVAIAMIPMFRRRRS